MRIFAISDLHLDYAINRDWLAQLSLHDHQEDVLILAGDISDKLPLLMDSFDALTCRFAVVLYVPGNHDLWVRREDQRDSLQKFQVVRDTAIQHGVRVTPFHHGNLAIIPLLGWYDYSFGVASAYLKRAWTDYRACRWPPDCDDAAVTRWFTERNPIDLPPDFKGITKVVTFSHFLPRIDLMPDDIPAKHRRLYPILGTSILETQLRQLGASTHVYGHSHVNRHVTLDGVTYVNNALGYPAEAHFTARSLVQVHDGNGSTLLRHG